MKPSITLFIFLLIASCQSQNGQEIAEKNEELTSKIDSIIENHDFNGVVLLTKDSTLIYKKALGYADIERKTALKPGDQFVVGSISKQITAVLILREYEKGNIALDDTIRKYLPEINQPWADKVSIHHLLTHTHGIVDMDKPLEFEPGTQFHYSQLGYELLAQVLENVSGKSFRNSDKINHQFVSRSLSFRRGFARRNLLTPCIKSLIINNSGDFSSKTRRNDTSWRKMKLIVYFVTVP